MGLALQANLIVFCHLQIASLKNTQTTHHERSKLLYAQDAIKYKPNITAAYIYNDTRAMLWRCYPSNIVVVATVFIVLSYLLLSHDDWPTHVETLTNHNINIILRTLFAQLHHSPTL